MGEQNDGTSQRMGHGSGTQDPPQELRQTPGKGAILELGCTEGAEW